jgi:transposase
VQKFQQVRGANKEWSEWKCFQEVAKLTGVTALTVRSWVQRWRKGEGFNEKPRSGRPPLKMTKQNLKIFKEMPKRAGGVHSSEEHRLLLEKRTGQSFSPRLIRFMRNKTGVKTVVKSRRPGLTQNHKDQRLEKFAPLKDHDAEWWKGVAFGDNHNIYWKNWKYQVVAPGQQPDFTTRFPSDAHQVTHTWGVMGALGPTCRTALVNPPRRQVEGKLTPTGKVSTAMGPDTLDMVKFKEDVCEEEILPFWKKWSKKGIHHIAMDNAKTHPEGVAFLKDHGVEILDWPSASPDMNPIEEVWSLIDLEVARKYAGKPRPTKEKLVEEHQVMFASIAVEKFKHCVETMPERVKQLIEAKGGQLKKNY